MYPDVDLKFDNSRTAHGDLTVHDRKLKAAPAKEGHVGRQGPVLSGQNRLNHVSVYVGQSEITAGMPVR